MDMLTTQDVVLTDKDFIMISDLVYKHCGINLHDGKKELVRARLSKYLRSGKFRNFSDYIKHVLEDRTGEEFSKFIDVISTNLTSFFREVQHFEFLKDRLIPEILQRKQKNRDFRIRAWSAGCSSGEEPYSIAITLLDSVKDQGRWDIKVLATDISTRMLRSAKTGIYDSKRIEPVSPQQKNRYLMMHKEKGQKLFEVVPELRNTIFFNYLNLMQDWPVKGPLDFIFCRNVMIYFDKKTQQKLVNRFYDILGPGGMLFTGHSESLTGIQHKFNYVQPTIYSKT